MKVLTPAADLVVVQDAPRRDERWAMCLSEHDAGTRRVQTLRVIRNDRVVDFMLDLGPARTFTAGPFVIVGALDGTDTVGELQDMADEERESDGLVKFLAERGEQSTLITDYIRVAEQMREYARRNPRTITNIRGSHG